MTESRISGELYYVDDYTDFSPGTPALQEGHYLALKFDAPEGATTTIQLLGAKITKEPQELDSDMNCVLRITDPLKQKLKVVCTMDDHSATEKIYGMTGLKLLDTKAPTT